MCVLFKLIVYLMCSVRYTQVAYMLMRRDNHWRMCVMFDSSYYIPWLRLEPRKVPKKRI